MSDIINQTEFTEKSHPERESLPPVVAVIDTPKKSKRPLVLTLVIVLIVVIGSITYVGLTSKGSVAVKVTPTPAPSEAPIETQGIQAEIAPYIKVIENSNPENDEHPFPPVNFELRIKDPNSR